MANRAQPIHDEPAHNTLHGGQKNSGQRAVIEYRRRLVAKIFHRGITQQSEIAETLEKETGVKVNRSTISRDLTALRKEWREDRVENIDEAQEEALNEILHLKREYWQAWASGADPRFLQGVQWCIDRRCKLLGLDAPDRLEHSGAVEMPVTIVEVVRPNDKPNDDS